MPSDWQALAELTRWFGSSTYAAYDHPWPTTPGKIREICRWFSSSDHYCAVCLKEDGRFIGYISLNPTEKPGVLNLGYCFHGDYHGRGYAGESCRAMLDYTFDVLKAEKIETGTAQNNEPSCRLLDRLGFTLTRSEEHAFLRDAGGQPVIFIGNIYELSRHRQK